MPYYTSFDWGNVANDYGSDFDLDYDFERDYGGGGYEPPAGEGPVIPDLTDPNNIPEVEIVGKAPEPYVFPDDMLIPPGDILQPVPEPELPDMGTIEIVDKRPEPVRPVIPEGPGIELPPYNPPIIEAPPIELPVIPEPEVPDMGTIEIVDKRPDLVRPVIPEGPVITLPPYEPPIIEAPPIELPVIPEEPPIVDPEPPVVLPPVIPEPPIVDPEPPVVLPPVIPPVVQPPVVTPPPVTVPPIYVPPVAPQPQQRGMGLNPGFMAPTDFYKTFDPAQSKYNWGSHGFQVGPNFNAKQYNQAAGSETPWGLQQLARGLTGAQINDIIAGKNITTGPAVPNAQRMEAYDPASMIVPNATNSYQLPTINSPGNTGTPNTGNQNVDYSNNGQYNQVASILGPDLARQQQEALARGDTETANRIQSQYEYAYQQQNQGGGD